MFNRLTRLSRQGAPGNHWLRAGWHLALSALLLASVLFSFFRNTQPADAFPAPMQVYYVSLPEADALTALYAINTAAVQPMYTYFSISIALDGTYVYYDQWEDGYAANLANPTSGEIYSATNLDGVQIWGNGEADDGCAPNIEGVTFTCTDANDVLDAGDVIIPNNTVALPRAVGQTYVLDNFTTAAYNRNDGNANWNGNWIEANDDGAAGAGTIYINTGSGHLRFRENTAADDSIYRGANLSSGDACSALSFTLGQNLIDANEDRLVVEVSGDGGTNYTILETFDAAGDAGAKSYPLSATYRTANFRLRFRALDTFETDTGDGEYWSIDDARVEWSCPLRFDAGDKVGATYAISMARSVWATTSSTLNAFAHEIFPVDQWGTAYESPIGTNTGAVGDASRSQFEYSTFTIMAAQDNTTVQIDANADGTYETSVTLNQGQATLSASLSQGARVQSDKPVQVTLLTGDINDSYESRDLALLPVSAWSSSYWSPVGVLWNTNPTRLYMYNLSTNGSIYITCERYGVANTTLGPVAARGTVTLDLGAGQGARCFASTSGGAPTGDRIFGIGTIDTAPGDGGGDDGSRSDWGVTLYPDTFLTTEALVGLGLGKDPTDTSSTENGSPLWVTAACNSGSTYVYVDWNNDGTADGVDTNGDDVAEAGSANGILVARLQSVRLFEPTADEEEYDQSGARVWSRTASGVGYGGIAGCKLAVAWGQDPNNATAGAPGLDVGTSVPPLPVIKQATIGNLVWLDENGDGYRNAGEAGIANATVQLWNWNHTTLIATTTTDAEGNYIFTNVVPGEYQVDVSSLPAGLVQTTVIGGTADNTNKADPFTLTVTAGGEALYADFGFNWAPPSDTDGNTGTGAIGDRIWIDDGNGIQEPGEPGMGGVSVQLLTAGADGILGTSDDVVFATTTSAADGSYIFDGLAAGAYAVRVNGGAAPAGYAQTGDPDQPGITCTACDNRTTTPILLAPGDVYVNADFGYQPTAGNRWNIGDTLWVDTDRDNTVDAGEPSLPGVTVALIRDLDGDGVWDAGEPIIASDVTDANGQYLFTNLPVTDGVGTDDYLVWVNDTENVLDGLIPTYDSNGAGTPNISAVTNMTAANNLAQDFAYAPYGHDSGDGLIGDTIFYDRNADNFPDAGEGMEGVRVNLYLDINADGNYDSGETLLSSTLTNENGQYFFGDLPAGNYVVMVDTATVPGYSVPNGVTNTYDPDTTSSPVNEAGVTLAAGGVNLTQDFGYRDANLPNSISGTIWNDTNADGVLSGEAGRFQNVTVVLRNSSGNIVATTTTDASGNYSFTNLPDGTYTVDVTDDNNVLNGYWHSLGTAGSDNNSQTDPYSVTVTGGQNNATADFGYYRDPAGLGNFVWEDLDGDGIQDGGEPGIPDIEVTLTITWPGGAGSSTLKTRTDASGLYSFGNLLLDEDFDGAGSPEPTFSISVSYPPAFTPSPQNQTTENADSDNPAGETATVTEGSTSTIYDFGFYRPATIGNSVWLDEDGNGIQDVGEAGIPNITVQLWNAGHTAIIATTTTDANGGYIFKNVTPGTYQVDVLNSSLPTGLVQTTVIGGTADNTNKADPYTLTVATGGEALYADFGFNWAPPSDTDGNTGTGAIGDRIWIDNGNGIQEPGEPGMGGVSVQLLTAGADGILGTSDDVVFATTTSAADGSYIFDGLAAGAYAVRVNGGAAPAGYAQTGDPDQPGIACTACDNRTTTPILLAPGDVYVNADFGYQPTAGNRWNIGDTLWVDTDRDNTVDAGEPLLGGVTVALIRDTNGDGVWDADGVDNITGTADDERIIANDVTDASGQYLFTNVPVTDGVGTDDYLVWVNDTENVLYGLTPTYDSNGAATPNISPVTNMTAADNLAQDFAYAPTGHDSGEGLIGDTIFYDRDADNTADPGEGMEGVRVNLYSDTNGDGNYDAGEPLLTYATTNENGQYFFGGLAAGNYVVMVDTATVPGYSVPNGVTNTYDPDTSSSPVNEAGVTLAAGGVNLTQDFGYRDANLPNSISGTIWNDTNANGVLSGEAGRFQNVTVVLRNSSGNIVATTTTDASGNYSFTNLPDGTYTVDVTDDNNVLNGYWHSLGTAGSDNNSQTDPYSVTVTGGQNNSTADFGYYRDPATIGNFVWLDRDGDGVQDVADEPGIKGVEVVLTITYPDLTVVTVRTITGDNGAYSFGNLLLDEDMTTSASGSGLIYQISVAPPSMTPSPEALPGSYDQTDGDSDGPSENATVLQGETDVTYDFGFTGSYDMGDLPDDLAGNPDYPTYFLNGPSNMVFPDGPDAGTDPDTTNGVIAVWAGTLVDTEVQGQPNKFATGDGSDEDGLTTNYASWVRNTNTTFTIIVNSSAATRVYYGLWIDWNYDGVFEAFYNGYGDTSSPFTINRTDILVQGDVTQAPVYARLRVHTQPLGINDYQGTLFNGETEDFRYYDEPTAVDLVSFFARPSFGRVSLNWTVMSELNTLGYNVYRSTSPDGPRQLLNSSIIPCLIGRNPPFNYQYEDTTVQPGVTYYYWLEAVSVGGNKFYGPLEATASQYGLFLPLLRK